MVREQVSFYRSYNSLHDGSWFFDIYKQICLLLQLEESVIRQRLGGRRDSAAQATGNSPPSSPPPIGKYTNFALNFSFYFQLTR